MARADLINRLYSRDKTPLEFQFQSLMAPPLLSLLSPYDIQTLYNIARDPKLSAKLTKKLEMIKSILEPRGFVKFHSGTNRVVYRYLEDQSFLIKIALDKVGLGDNPMEFQNQFVLAPFITKVFEVSPCGTVGLFERVEPITSRQEFISIAEDVFDLINDKFVGEFVLEDIGTNYFMNWGIRRGFGPVLLDFPYCYKLDGNKLYCNNIDVSTGIPCGGAIDYDMGFNNLVCTKCGSKIFAKDLQAGINKNNIILKGRKEHSTMKVQCHIPGQGNTENDTQLTAKNYAEQVKAKKNTMEIAIINNKPLVSRADEMKDLIARSQASRVANTEENPTAKELKAAEYNTDVATEFHERNMQEKPEEVRNANKHEYLPQRSAPYSRPEDIKSNYVEMNADDTEDAAESNDDTDNAGDTNKVYTGEVEGINEVSNGSFPHAEAEDAKSQSAIRDTARVRNDDFVDQYVDNGGRYPAKKQGRDSKGKFTKK